MKLQSNHIQVTYNNLHLKQIDLAFTWRKKHQLSECPPISEEKLEAVKKATELTDNKHVIMAPKSIFARHGIPY